MSWNNIVPVDVILYDTYLQKCEDNNIEPLEYEEWLDAKDKT